MHRRKALKSVGMILASPLILKASRIADFLSSNISNPPDIKFEDTWQWLKDNEHWIRHNWLLNAKPASDPHMIFLEKVLPFGQGVSKNHKYMQVFINKDPQQLIQDLMLTLVFSRGQEIDKDTEPWHYMSGFYDQVGRLPTQEDKVQVYYLKERWFNQFYDYNQEKVYSVKCLIKVDISAY